MAESYRALRTSLLLSNLGAPPKVIMVTSARPQEGKTTTSINTAIVLAQKGVRVLLIDADLRRPSIHKTLGMGPRSGLSNVLTGSATLQQTITTSPVLPNLFIMPAGTPPPNPAELLASSNMRDLIAELRGMYDHIVIDTPPTLSVTDAVVLIPSGRRHHPGDPFRPNHEASAAPRPRHIDAGQCSRRRRLAERRRSHLSRLLLLLRVSGEIRAVLSGRSFHPAADANRRRFNRDAR
jgi:capsular exopolysaccharide synthesis family protein